jgi:hypothetical protein
MTYCRNCTGFAKMVKRLDMERDIRDIQKGHGFLYHLSK